MLRNELYKPWFVGEKDWGVEIIDGEYNGTIIQIEKVDFPNDGNELQLDYHLIHKPGILTNDDITSDTFKAVIEVVVNDILREAINDYKQAGDNDSKESDSQ
jgi:hypothetical protein